jgi:DICT domain-containing protein
MNQMPPALDFSLYSAVNQTSTLNIFLARRDLLTHLSGVIEREIIRQQLQTCLYVGLQRHSLLAPVFSHYQQIAALTHCVYIFGVPDWKPPARSQLHCIDLQPDDRLANEWFVIDNHPQYAHALISVETTASGGRNPDRQFKGVITSDRAMVERLITRLRTGMT